MDSEAGDGMGWDGTGLMVIRSSLVVGGGMYLLFAGYTITGHAVPGVSELGDDIVSCEVANTSETEADREIGAVALEEITRGLVHWRMRDCLLMIILFSWRRSMYVVGSG